MLILDIETYKTTDESLISYIIAGKKRADYKESAINKLATNPHTGQVLLVGMLTDHEPIAIQGVLWGQHNHPEGDDAIEQTVMNQATIGLNGISERDVLNATWKIIAEELDNGGQIITYRGKAFDIPYLIKRSMILNVDPANRRGGSGIYYPYDLIKKYDQAAHLDLYDKLNPNYGEHTSLDMWAYIMGISPNINDEGGEKVGEWFEAGDFDKIREHCSMDIWKTFYIYERMKPWLT